MSRTKIFIIIIILLLIGLGVGLGLYFGLKSSSGDQNHQAGNKGSSGWCFNAVKECLALTGDSRNKCLDDIQSDCPGAATWKK